MIIYFSFYYNLYMLMLGSGLRPGEAYALTEKDIDFENNVIYVNKTLIYQKWEHMGDTKKTFHLDGPKTYCSVRLPLNSSKISLPSKIVLESKSDIAANSPTSNKYSLNALKS